jgi:hypothetical protein
LQLRLALTQQTNGALQGAHISSRLGDKQLHKLTEKKHLPPANYISSKHTSNSAPAKGVWGS